MYSISTAEQICKIAQVKKKKVGNCLKYSREKVVALMKASGSLYIVAIFHYLERKDKRSFT